MCLWLSGIVVKKDMLEEDKTAQTKLFFSLLWGKLDIVWIIE